MKKEKRFPVKEMIFAFLAVSKAFYYLNIIAAADGFEGVLSAMLDDGDLTQEAFEKQKAKLMGV